MSCKNCACPMKKNGTCVKNKLTDEEQEFLKILEGNLYLPMISEKGLENVPILEKEYGNRATTLVKELERKGVISLDYEEELKNFDYEKNFENIDKKGSVSLRINHLSKIDFSYEEKNKGE